MVSPYFSEKLSGNHSRDGTSQTESEAPSSPAQTQSGAERVFGSRYGFGTESRELMRVCEFGHAVRKVANRYYFNIGGAG